MPPAVDIDPVKPVDVNAIDWQQAALLTKAALLNEFDGYLDITSGNAG